MRTTLLSLLASFALVGCGAAGAQSARTAATLPTPTEFHEADENADDYVDLDEFRRATALYSREFDANGDGRLSDDEIADGLFRAFDENRSGRVDPSELERGAMRWWPASTRVRFDDWNTHPDRGLDEDELRAALEETAVLAGWDHDMDGAVSHDDLTRTLFASWDLDSSDHIDALEWRFDQTSAEGVL